MRKKVENNGLTVQGIAGSYVVLLGINMPEEKCKGLLGFAIKRQDHTENETYWLSGFKTFKSVEPDSKKEEKYSSLQHPIQGFTWSDYSAKADHDYTYEVVALRGTPANPIESESVAVKLKTESDKFENGTHQIHFNRGAAASQEYTRRFGDKTPDQVGEEAFKWLSRGAAEAIGNFIKRAKGLGWSLRVLAYEFTDAKVLEALKAANKRKVDVKVLYHAKNDSQKEANEKKIKEYAIKRICFPRVAKGLSLAHNKVMILVKKDTAVATLTGSTNFSVGGIYGHSNVVHICEDKNIAKEYLWLWNELKKNEDKKIASKTITDLIPAPPNFSDSGLRPIFSPRAELKALDWYAEKAKNANDALFMTFAFGMNDQFQEAYKNGQAKLRYALMEKMSGPTKTPEEKKANEAKIIDLRKMEENKFAIGAQLTEGAFNKWAAEKLSNLNVNVKYLHTKYMLVDPLGDNPLVISGSANFSKASTISNDENMLVIQSDPRVADIYLGEFMRLYNHFAFRDWASKHNDPKDAKVAYLDETDTWWKRYFGTSFASRQREYFSGENII